MKNDETYYALFDLAITGEKKAREFFTGLAAKCSGHADLAAFWKKLAAEESGHIGMLEELKSSLTARELNLPADHAMLWKAREVLQFSVEESLHKIKTLDDAYERAHELESSEINT
ncbi:MAG: ferritin family protein, partial [Pseudomonadota bacterium]